MSAYELEDFQPAQRQDYLRLLREAWGERSMSTEEFDWWFGRNPAGSLMSVAQRDRRVVGVASHSLVRMVLGGEERPAAFSVHATTEAAARGQGIFVALERRHEEQARRRGAAVVLAFASAPTEPLFLGPLGWTPVGQLRIWARPLPRAGGSRGLPELRRFDVDGDAAAGWRNHVVRSAEYLNWRYLDSPKNYRAFGAGPEYAVLGHKLHRGIPIALVADLVARDPRPLLRACLAGVRRGVRLLFALPAPEQRGAYLSLGFIPTPMSLNFMGKPLAGELDPDPRAWRLTLGDTDFF